MPYSSLYQMIHLSVGESEEKLDNVVYMPYNLWFKLVNRKLDILSPKSFRGDVYLYYLLC